MKRRALGGPWALSYRRRGEDRHELPVEATVPGNVDLDLSRAGMLPADLFFGENILAVRDWEDAEWWYSTTFSLGADDLGAEPELIFHGVDGEAEYFCNGELIGRSANALVEHAFGIAGAACAGNNVLVVHLRPLRPPPEAHELVGPWSIGEPLRRESRWVRKAAHAYGWDIMPRALSAGIWRPVEVVAHNAVEIAKLYPATVAANADQAHLRIYYELRGDVGAGRRYRLAVSGRCGSSSFRFEAPVAGGVGLLEGTVAGPRLWWPRDYGRPDLYELTTELLSDGGVVASRADRLGIRTVELERKASTPGLRREFRFVLNGAPVYCRGTNWLPLDVFHSRDAGLLSSRLDLLWRSNSNMVRCWGGNVYEGDTFFDWCDEHGVMVWQDFSLACAIYPQVEAFARVIRHEVRAVVRRLRHHPSIVLWCGDNEVDETAVRLGISPASNLLNRGVIPEVVQSEDPHRPYLPSSPYIDIPIDAAGGEALRSLDLRSLDLRSLPEVHLWGTRDFYKSDFYRGASAAFVSEIGFMGLPNVSSMRRFLDEGNLWPHENRQWLVHGTDPTVDFASKYWWRTAMTLECTRVFFGEVPSDLPTAVVASQLVQAEGFKYAIESGRQAKWARTGVLWWNLVDGWPQISDAVVDWYLREKLAFEVIAASQRPLLLLVGEPSGGRAPVVACNDTRRDVSGSFTVFQLGGHRALLEGDYRSPANQSAQIGELELPVGRSMLQLQWQDDDGPGRNHYLVGEPPFDLTRFRAWYEAVLGRRL